MTSPNKKLAEVLCPCCDETHLHPTYAGMRAKILCWECRPRWLAIQGRAINAVGKQIELGKLTKATEHKCVDCGAQASEWDHRDYSRWLDVQPVCHGCNRRRGHAHLPKDFMPDVRLKRMWPEYDRDPALATTPNQS